MAVKVKTTSEDPWVKMMAHGLPKQDRCQWQVLHFIGHTVVRVDLEDLPRSELPKLDWTMILNDITTLHWKVANTQAFVDAGHAIDPTRDLEKGWKFGIWTKVRGFDGAIAYKPITIDNINTGYYQVSIVRFTKYK